MSQRNRLFVLLVAVTLPMFALAALFVVTSVRESRASTERDTVALARAGVLATESFFDGHRRTLSAIALGFRDARRLTEPELRARLIDAAEANPEWDGMSVVGPDGIAIAGSRATSAGADLSERPYLQQMFATGRPVVSDGLRTLREGVPAVLIASPIAFEDGTTGGFVGSVSLSTLASALTQQLTTDARVGLIDRAGQTLVHPDAERVAVLLNVGDRPEVRAAFEGETGFIEAERDGEGTLVAFAPVESLGWAVTVAEDSSAAYAGADAIAWRGMIFVSLAVLAVAIGGWYLGGRLNRSYVEMQAARLAEAEARERAEAVLRSRDEFISIASHELRNPVAAVRGFGQLMQRRLDRGTLSEDDLREYVANISASGLYLSRLVEDLLSVSRLEGGRLDLQLEPADLLDVVQRASAEAPLQSHALRVVEPREPAMVRVDPDRITQILVNLLENAAKYSPPGSEIIVEIGRAGLGACVSVTDSGIGLPADDLARLFSPFGRAANARAANIPGLGLGLYVSRRLAEAHGGTLSASSAGEGHGSAFTLTLPLAPSTPSEPVHPDAMDGTDDLDRIEVGGRTAR